MLARTHTHTQTHTTQCTRTREVKYAISARELYNVLLITVFLNAVDVKSVYVYVYVHTYTIIIIM